jgi:hypothetical protein
MAVSFIGGGKRSTRRKPLTCRKPLINFSQISQFNQGVYRGRDHMAVEFTTTYAISAYHH